MFEAQLVALVSIKKIEENTPLLKFSYWERFLGTVVMRLIYEPKSSLFWRHPVSLVSALT